MAGIEAPKYISTSELYGLKEGEVVLYTIGEVQGTFEKMRKSSLGYSDEELDSDPVNHSYYESALKDAEEILTSPPLEPGEVDWGHSGDFGMYS
ncbi:MAG: hypothetical protein HYU48_00895, partial [Candidatus Levybacteria bacterium]|nr:hypothetical protein [Candidatus Levybacteria bacterium]